MNIRALHREIVARPGHWTRHLEGSYPDVNELRTLDALGKDWLYIDHGHAEMEWSTHCNSEVVRWSLRECGVTLVGPDPKSLVDEIGPDVLRAKMRAFAPEFLPGMLTWMSLDIAWGQRYAVTTFCRILHTLETGRVTSKRAALLWARDALDPRWSSLIQQTIDERAEYWADPTRPGLVEATVAFGEYVVGVVAGRYATADPPSVWPRPIWAFQFAGDEPIIQDTGVRLQRRDAPVGEDIHLMPYEKVRCSSSRRFAYADSQQRHEAKPAVVERTFGGTR